jgi:chitodextrinase
MNKYSEALKKHLACLLILISGLFCGTAMADSPQGGQKLPYSYGFEDNNLATDGWVLRGATSQYTGIGSNTDYSGSVRTGSYVFKFNFAERNAYLLSPVLKSGDNSVAVSFWYKELSNQYGDEQFQVGYTTNENETDASEFTYGEVVTASTSWQEYKKEFPAGTKRIAIKYIYNNAHILFLDDFVFESVTASKELPYSYGFENNDLAVAGWELQGSTISSTGISDIYVRTGSYDFRFSYAERKAYLLSPIFKSGANGVRVSFWYKRSNDNYIEQFQVGYTTDEYQTDASKFTYGEVVTASTSWQEYNHDFPVGTKRIAIKYVYNNAYYLFLDDFTFECYTSYPRPNNVAVSNVGMNSAVISWTSDASAWNLRYRKSGEEEWTTKEGISKSTGYTIDNLAKGSVYEVQVQAVEGDEVSDWTSTVHFTTAVELPYSYGFENKDLTADGWVLLQGKTHQNTGIGGNGSIHGYGRTGETFVSYYGYPGNYLLSPVLKNGTNDVVVVSFWYRELFDRGYEKILVGYTTDEYQTDASKFTYNGELVTASTSWQEYTNEFPKGTKRIAIWHTYGQDNFLLLDDFTFEFYPRPKNVAVSNVSMNSAVVSWTSDASAWNLRYRKSGEEQWTTKKGVSQSTGYTVDNLTDGSRYEVQVQAVKDDKVSDWTSSVNFTTLMDLPYSYSFENNDLLADGWILQGATSANTGISDIYVLTGSYSFMFHYSEMNVLLSPTFKSGANGVAVSFWYRAYNSKYPELFQVGYTTNANETDASKFTYGDVVTASMTSWQEYTNEFPAGTRRIAIKYIDNGSYYLYLDDFAFWESGYPRPTDVAVSSIGMNSAVVSWTSEANEWNLRYRKSGEQWTIKEGISQSTGYTIDNLTKGTKYEVQVQAVKGDKVSGWTNSVSFTTKPCENQCYINIELTDSYGDGWTGGKLEAVEHSTNEVLGTYTIESGANESYTLAVCPGCKIDFVYTQGEYASENGWHITDVNGEVIVKHEGCNSGCDVSSGILASYTVDCTITSWKRPSGLAVSEIESKKAKLSWIERNEPAATSWVIAYKADGTSDFTEVEVSGNPYTLTGLAPDTRYTVKVRPVTNDGVIRWSNETTFRTEELTPAPTGFTVSGLTNISASISWNGFANSYDVRYGVVPEGSEHSYTWLQYDDGDYASTVGDNEPQEFTWGVMYPGSQVMGSKLTKVSIYETEYYNVNDITINIYQGGDEAPGTLLYTETVSTEHADAFHEVTLAKPVALTAGENLWITLTEYGTYMMSYSDVTPNSNTTESNYQWLFYGGEWVRLGNVSPDCNGYSWMIRGYMETIDADDGSVAWTDKPSTNEKNYKVASLNPNTQYVFQVRGDYGENGKSAWASVYFTTKSGLESLQDAWIQAIADVTFTGEALTPAIVVKNGEVTLSPETDYTVSYSNNTNAGQATVTIAAKEGSGYTGTATATFNIVPIVVDGSGAVKILRDQDGTRAVIDGEFGGDGAVSITKENIEVSSVVYNREFMKDTYSTMVLPFSVNTNKVSGLNAVLYYNGIGTDKDGNDAVRMKVLWATSEWVKSNNIKDESNQYKVYGDATLSANTPYLVQTRATTLKVTGPVTIEPTAEAVKELDGWKFRGMWEFKRWDAGDRELGYAYGFAASAPKDSKIEVGDFVKIGEGTYIYPLRAYLVSSNIPDPVQGVRANGAYVKRPTVKQKELPELMSVIVDDEGDGKQTTVIGQFNTRTGEFKMNNAATKRTFDVKGRNVGNKANKARGAYYGKKTLKK